jgi:hypothetical protein
LALAGRDNKSQEKKNKSPRDFENKFSMPEQQPPKKEKNRKEERRKGAF